MQTVTTRWTTAILLAATLAACGGDDGSSTPPPEVGKSRFSLSTSITLMQLCLESYQMLTDFENGQTFTLPSPFTLEAQFSTEEHFTGEGLNGMVPIAFVGSSGNSIYVVFRGTKTISEWISDATATQVDYILPGSGLTETGFTDIYTTIDAAIIDEVNSLAANSSYTALYITGHSLGGALAVLAAPDLAAKTRFKQPIVYTFAGPRAGDPIFAFTYGEAVENSWRVVNTNDEVPKLPNVVTVIFRGSPRKEEIFLSEHVDEEFDITFGGPIHSIGDLIFNHSSCNYFATLCGMTRNPAQCEQAGQGLNGCNFS